MPGRIIYTYKKECNRRMEKLHEEELDSLHFVTKYCEVDKVREDRIARTCCEADNIRENRIARAGVADNIKEDRIARTCRVADEVREDRVASTCCEAN